MTTPHPSLSLSASDAGRVWKGQALLSSTKPGHDDMIVDCLIDANLDDVKAHFTVAADDGGIKVRVKRTVQVGEGGMVEKVLCELNLFGAGGGQG